jgi:hypothetical protein
MMARVTTALAVLTRPAKLPVRLLHEATHIAAAAPWCEDWRLVVGPTDSADELGVDIAWGDGAPWWGVALAFLAPMLLGLVGAACVAVAVVTGGVALPQTTFELALWSAAGLGWVLYSIESPADIAGALVAAKQRGDDE